MSSTALSIPFSLTGAVDKYWVRLEQVTEEETATFEESAKLIDEIFSIDPCIPSNDPIPVAEEEEEEETLPEPPVEEDEFNALVRMFFPMAFCDSDDSGDHVVQIKVILSHPGEPYTLRLDNGIIGPAIVVEEEIHDHITIKNKSSVVLEFPVVGAGIFEWGNSSTNKPDIIRTGNTLVWSEPVTGSITVKYPTRYELVEVIVEGTEESEPGECKAVCFYHGMVAELDIEYHEQEATEDEKDNYCNLRGVLVPGEDTPPNPWITKEEMMYCKCSGEYTYSKYSNLADEWDKLISKLLDQADSAHKAAQDTDDPILKKAHEDSEAALRANAEAQALAHSKQLAQFIFPGITEVKHGAYIDCDEEEGFLNQFWYYREKCCIDPWYNLPDCYTYYSRNMGVETIDEDLRKALVAQYGDKLRIQGVMPEDEFCGYTKIEWKVNAADCCEGVEEIEWNYGLNPEILNDYTNYILYISGGKASYTWRVTGQDVKWHATGTQVYVSPPSQSATEALLVVGNTCGTITVTITDECEHSLTVSMRAADGQWAILDPETDADKIAECEAALSGKPSDSFGAIANPDYAPCASQYGSTSVTQKWKIYEEFCWMQSIDIAHSCPPSESIESHAEVFAGMVETWGENFVTPITAFPAPFESDPSLLAYGSIKTLPFTGFDVRLSGGGDYSVATTCYCVEHNCQYPCRCICYDNCSDDIDNCCDYDKQTSHTVVYIWGHTSNYEKHHWEWVC